MLKKWRRARLRQLKRLVNGVENTYLAQILEQHKSVSFYKAAPFLELARLALVLASLRWPDHDAPLLCATGSQMLGPLAPLGVFREAFVDASASFRKLHQPTSCEKRAACEAGECCVGQDSGRSCQRSHGGTLHQSRNF